VAQDDRQAAVVVQDRPDRCGDTLDGQRVRILIGQHALRQVADFDQVPLQGADIDVAKPSVFARSQGGRRRR
jgi:hypothetical protein